MHTKKKGAKKREKRAHNEQQTGAGNLCRQNKAPLTTTWQDVHSKTDPADASATKHAFPKHSKDKRAMGNGRTAKKKGEKKKKGKKKKEKKKEGASQN